MGRSLRALLLAGATACSLDPYHCDGDEQCRRGERTGTCEPVGFCSYPDDGCPSGSRFSPNAADALADACVQPQAMTSSTAGDSGDASESGGVLPPARGEVRWERGFPSVQATAIAVDEIVAIGGTRATDGVPWIAGLTVDGDDAFGEVALEERASTVLTDIAVVADATTAVGHGPGAGELRAWIARVDAAGQLVDETLIDTLAPERFAGAVPNAAVGQQGDDGWIHWFGGAGDVFAPGFDFIAAAARPDGAVGIVDSNAGFRVLLPGGTELLSGTAPDAITAIAFGGDGGFVVGGASTITTYDPAGAVRSSVGIAGTVAAVAADRVTPDVFVATTQPPAIARLDPAGDALWSASPTFEGAPVTPVGLAVDASGDLFVSGDAQGTAWVGKIDP